MANAEVNKITSVVDRYRQFIDHSTPLQGYREVVKPECLRISGQQHALSRELSPILTAVVVAGRVGSAFAAELGTMRVSERIDALYVLKTNPVDYLAVPRVVACIFMLPGLAILSFFTGMAGGVLIANQLYDMSPSVFLSSAHDLMSVWDLCAGPIKGTIFGASRSTMITLGI